MHLTTRLLSFQLFYFLLYFRFLTGEKMVEIKYMIDKTKAETENLVAFVKWQYM